LFKIYRILSSLPFRIVGRRATTRQHQ